MNVSVHSFSTLHAVHSAKSIQFFVAAINRMFVHCETLTTSKSTLHNLTGPLSDRCVPNTIKQLTPVKRKQRDTGGPDMPSHLSVTTHQSLEKSLIHTDPLLICPADTEATAKTSVPVWQHDHSCFHQGGEGTLLLSPSQREIKWNAVTSLAENTLHLIHLVLTPASEDARININFQLLVVCELISR